MGYFAELAKNIPVRTDDELAQLLRDSLLTVNPKLYAEFEQAGELDAYIAVKVDDFHNDLQTMMAQGTDEQAAREFAMESFFPTDPDEEPDTKDYEIEGAQEDEAAALADWLGL